MRAVCHMIVFADLHVDIGYGMGYIIVEDFQTNDDRPDNRRGNSENCHDIILLHHRSRFGFRFGIKRNDTADICCGNMIGLTFNISSKLFFISTQANISSTIHNGCSRQSNHVFRDSSNHTRNYNMLLKRGIIVLDSVQLAYNDIDIVGLTPVRKCQNKIFLQSDGRPIYAYVTAITSASAYYV